MIGNAETSRLRFVVNQPAVVADIIDGEAVIMNLEKGDYYSLDLTGADVWRLIAAGHAVGEIAAAFAERYGVTYPAAEADIAALSRDLVAQSLIVEANAGKVPLGAVAPAALTASAYAVPRLHVYADMKELLALDPPLPEFKSSSGS